MLAKSPLCQTWHDDSKNQSRLLESGITLAIIDCAYGRWDGRIEQSVIKHHAKSTRSTVGGLSGYTNREACKIAVEDRIHAVRNPDPSFAKSDAAALGREVVRAEHEMDMPHDGFSIYDVLAGRWVA